MGTALTDQQATMLSLYTGRAIIMLDGDKAGRKGTVKAIYTLLKAGVHPYVYVLSNNTDPDDFVKSYNYDTKKISYDIKENMKDGIEYIIEEATKRYASIAIEERKNAIRQVTPLLELLSSEDRKVYESSLLRKLDLKG